MHWSDKNDDENKRGKPIIEFGKFVLRDARQKPDCKNCNKQLEWTDENHATYNKYLMHEMGIEIKLTEKENWDFVRIKYAENNIRAEERKRWQTVEY